MQQHCSFNSKAYNLIPFTLLLMYTVHQVVTHFIPLEVSVRCFTLHISSCTPLVPH